MDQNAQKKWNSENGFRGTFHALLRNKNQKIFCVVSFWTNTYLWCEFHGNRARGPYLSVTVSHILPLKGWPDRQVATFRSLYCRRLPTCQKVNVNMLVNKMSPWMNWWCGHPFREGRIPFPQYLPYGWVIRMSSQHKNKKIWYIIRSNEV